MRIDFAQAIKDLDGQDLRERKPMDSYSPEQLRALADWLEQRKLDKTLPPPVNVGLGEIVTLKAVACSALLNVYDDERNLSGEKKASRYSLAIKINEGGTREITTEEAADLKTLIAKNCGTLVVGYAFRIIEGKIKAAAEAKSKG